MRMTPDTDAGFHVYTYRSSRTAWDTGDSVSKKGSIFIELWPRELEYILALGTPKTCSRHHAQRRAEWKEG